MTHNEKRSVWWKEGIAALITGTLYGVTNALVGHPLDTIKTKMQVVSEYNGLSMRKTALKLYKSDGLLGFFRGVFPPLFGSSMFRAAQFSVFEACYTLLDHHFFFCKKIPFTMGLEYRIVFSGLLSGTARSIIECPFEYSKVQGQTGRKWRLNNIYQGFSALWIRSTGLMTIYFILVDTLRRNTSLYKTNYGVFIMNGLCSSFSFALIWPIEIAKNIIQSQTNYSEIKRLKIFDIIKQRIKVNGLRKGLYMGCLPGLLSVFMRNGAAMMVMIKAQNILTYFGFRD